MKYPTPVSLRAFLAVVLLALAGCGADGEAPLFERLPAERTGVRFVNELVPDTTFNLLNYLYYYDGGGVAVGDLSGDGLPDLYFTANQGPNRLYLNRGGLRFEDVTERAGAAGAGDWKTGVTMADVNGDGRLDLYVSVLSGFLGRTGRNQLLLNQGPDADGVPTFTEEAEAYGLDFAGYGTQAAFFDYDRDGDLDAYLLNHSTHLEDTHGRSDYRYERHPTAGDRLLRNDGGRFTDVSAEAGIYGGRIGYGLGVVASDLNLDGCPDLYVANDFHENDYLYYNNCDGTFTESLRTAMAHTSYAAMGVDAADFNNDGRPDVVVLDMLPERMDIRNTSAGEDPHGIAALKVSLGYHYQHARNTLQLNLGGGRFSEIGMLAGIHATDWSWAPLFADLDNDGWRDLFVSNGIYRRPNDLDVQRDILDPVVQASLRRGVTAEHLQLVERMPRVPIPNYAFRNNGDLTFTDRAAAWGLDAPGFSNGAAYGDLDNDGDLDLVVNNLNEEAAVYENRADRLTGHHALTVALRGSGANTGGIGARVFVKAAGRQLYGELMPTRGYQSSVDPRLHFGLGTSRRVDTLLVVWNDGRAQLLTDVPADTLLVLRQTEADRAYAFAPEASGAPRFEDVTAARSPDYRHRENTFLDFTREPLIPHKLSTEGPALAVGDVDGDGLDDLFAGGAKWQPARLFLQGRDGRFTPTNEALLQADSLHEDVDAAFFDADGDGDLDLYVVSGGNEFWGESEALLDRLYLNDGAGGFRRSPDGLPRFHAHGGAVAPADFDGDGDVDLFVGSRVEAYQYGRTPQSRLLENDGRGRFTDVTHTRAEGLAEAGMVTDAAWADLTGDGALDLVVAGEWMPLRLFAQEGGRLVERTDAAGLGRTNGWWNTVLATDLDGDGDRDLVAGNLGLNSLLKAGPERPARLYVRDFDDSGTLDAVLTTYHGDVSYPFGTRDQFVAQIPALQKKYRTYAAFGASRLEEIFTGEQLRDAEVREAYTFATSYALNEGDGTFTVRPLPVEAQFAPVYAVMADDFDGDGAPDLLLGGNFFGATPMRGRYDASRGVLLQGDGRGGFRSVPLHAAGLLLEGEVRDLQPLTGADGARMILAARNNDRLQVLLRRDAAAVLARLE